jgi:hypothetical protein
MSCGLPTVDQDIGMMNRALVTGPDLQPARCGRPECERQNSSGHPGRQRATRKVFGFYDYVGVAELLAFDELRLRRRIRSIPLECALIDPRLHAADLFITQPEILDEWQLTRLGKPRRHDAPLRDLGDLGGVRLGVGEQRSRCELPGVRGRAGRHQSEQQQGRGHTMPRPDHFSRHSPGHWRSAM